MNRFHNIPFRSKIFISLILVSTLTLFISTGVIFQTSSNDLKDNMIDTYTLNVSQISNTISYIFLDMLNIANETASDEEIVELLLQYNNPDYEEEQVVLKQSIENLLPQRTNNYVVGLESIVFTTSRNIFYSGAQEFFYQFDFDEISDSTWFQNTIYTNENLGYLDSTQMFDFATKNNYFYIIRTINDSYSGEQLASLRIGFDSDYIHHVISNIIGVEYTAYIINDDNYVLCCNDSDLTGITLTDETIDAFQSSQSILIQSDIDNTPWTLLVTLPYKNISLDTNSLLIGLLISVIFSLVISAIISFFVSQSIATPINRLTEKVKAINIKGFKQIEVTNKDKDEIIILKNAIDHMSKYMDDIMENLILKEQQKVEAEINFLRMQINPHFLHNTLKTIPYLVKQGRLEENTSIVTSLTTILRESMVGSSAMIPLSKELDLLKKYLFIMQVRYDYTFDFSIEEFPEFADILIPRLTLQPLVENAVFHAFSDNTTFLSIKIDVRYYDENKDRVQIIIQDNGCGMTEARLAFINKTIEHYELFSKQQGSIGVPNVAKRLKYYFNNPVMYFESEINKGTSVNLIIDKIKENSNENIISG